jgi:hypothetical protein
MKVCGEITGPKRAIYRIRVHGLLDDTWSQWFDDMSIACERAEDGTKTTTLTGAVDDQPRLRGILARMWDLNLTVLSVERIALGSELARTQRPSQAGGERWENT